jgi:hypothetical protein
MIGNSFQIYSSQWSVEWRINLMLKWPSTVQWQSLLMTMSIHQSYQRHQLNKSIEQSLEDGSSSDTLRLGVKLMNWSWIRVSIQSYQSLVASTIQRPLIVSWWTLLLLVHYSLKITTLHSHPISFPTIVIAWRSSLKHCSDRHSWFISRR